jgi:ABC-2 type transport system permease protein
MIPLFDVERIKLFSTRAAWWCLGLTALVVLGLAVLSGRSPTGGGVATTRDTQIGGAVGQIVLMVLAIVSVTGEHRFGTIRATYLAAPRRWQTVLAKAGTLGALGLVVGTVLAFASLGLATWLVPGEQTLSGPAEWRQVAGVGPNFAVGMVIAVSIATLLRHAAGAVSVLLVWVLVVENLVAVLPYGHVLFQLMPFQAQAYFVDQVDVDFAYPPVFGFVYSAAVAAVLLCLAVLSVERRDAG